MPDVETEVAIDIFEVLHGISIDLLERPTSDTLESVLLPSIIAHGTATLDAEANARDLVTRVGLKGAEYKRPGELSGGMQQPLPDHDARPASGKINSQRWP